MTMTSLISAWNEQAPYKTALDALQQLHWSVFPLGLDKRPPCIGWSHPDGSPRRLGWKIFQSRHASPAEVLRWQQQYQPSAYAVITGAISNVLILDFDIDDAGGKETLEQLRLHPHVQTGSGGYHVYFQYPGWYVPTLSSKSKKELGRRWPGLDIRADGRYGAFCGRNWSGSYVWLRNPELDALILLPNELRDLLGLLHAPEKRTAPQEKEHPTPLLRRKVTSLADVLIDKYVREARLRGRNNAGFDLACQLRDNGYAQAEAEAALRLYAQRVPATNSKGKHEDYTETEALASVESAYRQAKRQAWDPPENHSMRTRPASSGSGNGGSGRSAVGASTPTPPEGGLPEIIIGADQLRDITDEAVAAIVRQEQSSPTLFMQSARLLRVGRNERKQPLLTQMGITEIKEVLTHSANFYRLKKVLGSDGEYEKLSIYPPKDLAEQILARQTQKPYLPFPALEAIVETPVIRPDGSILDRPGYDPATRLYYAPQVGMQVCTVPHVPTRAQRETALARIEETIGEFPYVSEADHANALALLLTPLVRPAIKRHVPLALLDAPKPGTGKGLLADVVSLIATGSCAAILAAPEKDEEWDKRITAILLQGRTIICIDNIVGTLQSASLEGVLTAEVHEGRVLGQSTMVKVPNRATWLATGNNIRLGGDLPRRCYRIRLDPHVSRPWMRSGFTHEDLAGWVTEQRASLIAALLTLARAWFVAGQPHSPDIPALATFTPWAKTVGSILAYAGVTGFLGNLEQLYEESDMESAQWEAFLQAWYDTWGEAWITIAEIIAVMNGQDAGSVSVPPERLLGDMLPEALQFALKERPTSFKIRLGKALEKRIDTCYGKENLRLERGKNDRKRVGLWRVVAGSAGSASYPQRREKLEGEENNI